MTATPAPSGPLISFARGAPSLDIIDIAGLRSATARALDEDPAAATGYGPATGYPPLRAWIAGRHGVDVDQVLITNGSLQADAFLFEHLVSAGDDVVLERPTYDRTLLNLRNLGAKIHQVSLDDDGIDVDELRALVESGVRPKIAHVIPNFQNPAGVSLALDRRLALIDLARAYRFTIFEDDPYAQIGFADDARAALPSMLSLAAGQPGVDTRQAATGAQGATDARGVTGTWDGRTDDRPSPIHTRPLGADDEVPLVVHASSFTKTICPGIRVGYLVGPRQTIANLARRALNTYISPNVFAEAVVYQFCVSGDIDRSIATVRTVLARRADLLAAALRREIPDATFRKPGGGYFLWVNVAADVDVERLVPAAAARGVAVVPGTSFLLDGGQHSLRLAFSAVPTDQVDEGVRRLAAAIADVRTG